MEVSSALYVTILPGLLAIDIVVVETYHVALYNYIFKLFCDVVDGNFSC